jgi:flagellar hook-associated protein 3 FlgL
MRVSDQQRYKQVDRTVTRARQYNSDALEKVATLKEVNRLSDDPIGVSKIVKYKDRSDSIPQYLKNIDFAKGFLEKTEMAVSGITENLIRAKELAIALSNSTYDAGSRKATASELSQIVDEVVSLGNSDYADRYVFSGFRTNTPAISHDGRFLGDDGAIFFQVDSRDFKQINLQARELFEGQSKGDHGLIDTLKMLQVGLDDDDVGAIRRSMDFLDKQIQKTTSYQATLGALHKSLENSSRKVEGEEIHLLDQMAKIEQIDVFKASSESQRSEAVLQSTLLASNKLLQPSLLNFMQ